MKKKHYLILLIGIVGIILPVLALAVNLEVGYPVLGPEQDVTPGGGPVGWVRYIFYFALLATGIAAVGSLIYAGILWMTSGASEKIQEARERIQYALIGLLLAAGSVVLLQVIDPDLIKLRAPTIESYDKDAVYREMCTDGYKYDPMTDKCELITIIGQECEIGKLCPGGLICLNPENAEVGKCIPRLSEGTACVAGFTKGLGDYVCADDLFCDFTTTGTCIPRREKGETCLRNEQCKAKSCNEVVRQCGIVGEVPEGESCVGKTDKCLEGLFCDTTSGFICKEKAANNQNCTLDAYPGLTNQCQSGCCNTHGRCDIISKCQ